MCLKRLGVTVLFAEAEVYDVDHVQFLAHPHEKVVWLDVPVQKALGMHVLDTTQHLVRQH